MSIDVRAFVQARMSSSRFPGKVLAPFRGEPVVLHVVRRVEDVLGRDAVVVTTSDQPADEPLVAYLAAVGVQVYRGPLDDVFERFRGCASAYPCEWILRVSADSPLIDSAEVRKVVEAADDEADVVTNTSPRTVPPGQAAELIRAATLLAVESSELDAYEREHVTPFFYRRPERFRIRSVAGPGADAPATVVDTVEDLARLETLA